MTKINYGMKDEDIIEALTPDIQATLLKMVKSRKPVEIIPVNSDSDPQLSIVLAIVPKETADILSLQYESAAKKAKA